MTDDITADDIRQMERRVVESDDPHTGGVAGVMYDDRWLVQPNNEHQAVHWNGLSVTDFNPDTPQVTEIEYGFHYEHGLAVTDGVVLHAHDTPDPERWTCEPVDARDYGAYPALVRTLVAVHFDCPVMSARDEPAPDVPEFGGTVHPDPEWPDVDDDEDDDE